MIDSRQLNGRFCHNGTNWMDGEILAMPDTIGEYLVDVRGYSEDDILELDLGMIWRDLTDEQRQEAVKYCH